MLHKLALIYSAMDKFREAEEVLQRAVEMTGVEYRDRLYFNLANVKYELGKYDQAEQMYKALKKGSPYIHAVQTQLALIDLHRGLRVDEARAFLRHARDTATGLTKTRIDDALRGASSSA